MLILFVIIKKIWDLKNFADNWSLNCRLWKKWYDDMSFIFDWISISFLRCLCIDLFEHFNVGFCFAKMLQFFDRKPVCPHLSIPYWIFFYSESFFQWSSTTVIIFWVHPVIVRYSMTEYIVFESVLAFMLVLFPIAVCYFLWILWN